MRMREVSILVMLSVQLSTPTTAGYLTYCPCMGRFGNQADQFLGSLAFAKGVGRTLVLPPWVMYSNTAGKVNMVHWDTVFNVTVLSKYHRVITMQQFMEEKADQIWPVGKRVSFCYTARNGKLQNSCNAKDGSPFGPFWNHFDINFDRSEMFAPLNFRTDISNLDRWSEMFPASTHPVLAMTGAPASFPVMGEHVALHRYLQWTDSWRERGREWVEKNLPRGKWLGIHLRNGGDWDRACEHTQSAQNLFSSPQCLGYKNEHGQLSTSLCMPDSNIIMEMVKSKIRSVGAAAVFVASDNDHMLMEFRNQLKKENVSFHKLDEDNSLLDLVILGQSSHFIGNCVSSFSAFVKRERDVTGLPSSFWSFNDIENKKVEL